MALYRPLETSDSRAMGESVSAAKCASTGNLLIAIEGIEVCAGITAYLIAVSVSCAYCICVCASLCFISCPAFFAICPPAERSGCLLYEARSPAICIVLATALRLCASTAGSSTGLLKTTDIGPIILLVFPSPTTVLNTPDIASPA